MNKELSDVLFEALEVISKHDARLEKLDKQSKEVTGSIKELKTYLEKKIEEASKEVLTELLDSVSVTNNVSNEVKVDTSELASEISKLIQTKFNTSVNIEPQNIKVDIDTKAIADKLDNTGLIQSISKQIEESNKATRVLLTEMISIQKTTKEVKPTKVAEVKSIRIIRDTNNLIDSLEIVKG